MKTNTIINVKNGDFYLSENEILNPNLSFKQVSKFKNILETWNDGKDFASIKLITPINNLNFYVCVKFHQNKIFMIEFKFTEQNDNIFLSLENWQDKEKLKLHKQYKKWLKENISLGNKFRWGNIESFYDRKNYQVGMFLRYRPELAA